MLNIVDSHISSISSILEFLQIRTFVLFHSKKKKKKKKEKRKKEKKKEKEMSVN